MKLGNHGMMESSQEYIRILVGRQRERRLEKDTVGVSYRTLHQPQKDHCMTKN
jgi:hypothetical protein